MKLTRRNVGGAGLVGGALLMDAVEDHDEREREIGYEQGLFRIFGTLRFLNLPAGFDNGWNDNQVDNWDGGGW